MLAGFKKFIIQGSAVDIAVGIIMGVAFGAVVTAIVDKVIMPLVAAIAGKPNFDDVLAFTINDSTISIGAVITAVVNLVLVGAAVYFCIVLPINTIKARRAAGESTELTTEEKILATLERIADK